MKERSQELIDRMKTAAVSTWSDIEAFLLDLEDSSMGGSVSKEEFNAILSKGVAFITYDFGIDGVSIEIFKYAECLEGILGREGSSLPLHFIGGDFHDKADVVLKPCWNRFHVPGLNGWSKWYDGKWFSRLFYEDMPEGSDASKEVAVEMWDQAKGFAEKISAYLRDNGISMLVPVNIPTNPGNFPAMLALIMVTEGLGTYVLSSNHDYYWEGGRPASERGADEEAGPRDHFFKNMNNSEFFSLFKKMYPWNGQRWIQVNINSPQSDALVERFGFKKEKFFELGTAISDDFFMEFGPEDAKLSRKKMAYILSGGKPLIKTKPIDEHLASLSDWMGEQHPLACSYKETVTYDPTTDGTIYCLQPTRVIGRKRIEMDFQMLKILFNYGPFSKAFADNSELQLVVHITGPVPVENQADLETVLNAYKDLCSSVDEGTASRIFIAFSVGTEDHPALEENGLEPMTIEQIYRLATVILFPSETEGRGLPIVESSACGIPIICSRYFPEEVFSEVVGEGLSDEEQIKYLLFPEGNYSDEFLAEASELLLDPEKAEGRKAHNKQAVRLRYSTEMIKRKFELFIETLRNL